jgi:hypothetical protein
MRERNKREKQRKKEGKTETLSEASFVHKRATNKIIDEEFYLRGYNAM